jgi:hypothetical protein
MNELDHIALLERYSDIKREADRSRHIGRAQTDEPRRLRLYMSLRTWLGHRLVAWGRRLQTLAVPPKIRVAEHSR